MSISQYEARYALHRKSLKDIVDKIHLEILSAELDEEDTLLEGIAGYTLRCVTDTEELLDSLPSDLVTYQSHKLCRALFTAHRYDVSHVLLIENPRREVVGLIVCDTFFAHKTYFLPSTSQAIGQDLRAHFDAQFRILAKKHEDLHKLFQLTQ